MSRRHAAEKREILPDPKFGDVVLTKFMNMLMYEGKKSVAEAIIYGALDRIKAKTGNDPVKMFHDARGNVGPRIEVRSRRAGGATYQVDRKSAGWGRVVSVGVDLGGGGSIKKKTITTST